MFNKMAYFTVAILIHDKTDDNTEKPINSIAI